MAAVDHEPARGALLVQRGLGVPDAGRVVVRAALAAAENDEAVLVAGGADDGHEPGLGDGQEVVRVAHGADGVDGDVEAAVGAVLEADGEAEARGELAVQLALGGAGADGADAQQVGEKLGRDGVEQLAGQRHTAVRQVDEELPADAQALVDAERVVDVRVVDQALPADRRARLLEVRAHHDQQIVLVLAPQREQALGVLKGGGGVVDGAGADDDEKPPLRIGVLDDRSGLIAGLDDRLLGLGGLQRA